MHALVLQQLETYFSSLASSRLCLVGSGSSGSNSCRHVEWTLQKYYEAAAVGCVVVGDVPADRHFTPFVPLRLAGLDAAAMAGQVEQAVAQHTQGEYDSLVHAAREYVLAQRTCKRVMDQFYLPALRDYLQGGRTGGVHGDQTTRTLTSNTACSSEPDSFVGNSEEGEVMQQGVLPEEVVPLWSMAVSLAAPQQMGDLPVVMATVIADHGHSPEKQVWSFCEMYQIIDLHCHLLLQAMQGTLGREAEGFEKVI